MNSRYITPWIVGVAGLILIGGSGCSTKWTESGGDSVEQGLMQADRSGADRPAAGGRGDETRSGTPGESEFPDLSRRGHDGSDGGPLSGIQSLTPGQSPDEERLNRNSGDAVSIQRATSDRSPDEERLNRGTLVAKGQGSESANRKTAQLRREEAAAVAAGLKDVFFGYDSWAIQEEGRQALTHNAEWLKENPQALLKIEGHCDERGTQDYNLVLGEKRAKATRSYLVELGVSTKQLAIVSYGKEQPFCFDRNEPCYQQNRRGHVLLQTK